MTQNVGKPFFAINQNAVGTTLTFKVAIHDPKKIGGFVRVSDRQDYGVLTRYEVRAQYDRVFKASAEGVGRIVQKKITKPLWIFNRKYVMKSVFDTKS